jgi:HEAT repeat protein
MLFAALLTLGAFAQEAPDIDAAFEAMRTFAHESAGNPGLPITDAIMAAHGDEAARAELARKLAGLLDAETSFPAKRFACQHLYVIGTAAQVPALAPMLGDPELTNIACYALQTIPGGEAEGALIGALGTATGDAQINIVNTLRMRAPEAALEPLAELLPGDSPELQEALLLAISAIGLEQGGAVLQRALDVVMGIAPPEVDERVQLDSALPLMAALASAGGSEGLESIRRAYENVGAKAVKMAALEAWVNADAASALPVVAGLLSSGDAQWVAQACGYVRTLEGEGATQAFLEMLDEDLPVESEAILIAALVDRGDRAALPTVMAALDAEHEGIRAAALRGLGTFGDATSAIALAHAAATGSGDLRRVARESLVQLPDSAADAALTDALDGAEPAVQEEIIRALSGRGARSAVPSLLTLASEGEANLRQAAIGALGQLSTHEQLPQLLELLSTEDAGGLSTSINRAIVDVARKADVPEARASAIHAVLEDEADPEIRTALLALLGQIGDPTSMPVIERALESDDAEVRLAAVKSLSDWPDATPLDRLAALAETDPADPVKSTALGGYIRLLREGDHEDAAALVGRYEKALELARTNSDQRRILAGLAELKDRAALDLVSRYLDDESLRGEAAVAAERIRSNFYVLSASHESGAAKYAMDGNIDRRWTSGTVMQGGEWFLIDMTETSTVAGIVLDTTRSPGDYPRGYRVYVFDDPEQPGEPVAEGEGAAPVTEIRFEPTAGRYIKIEQTGQAGDLFWSIDEMRLIAQ